ncbi:MAG: hypothetical protein JW801_01230 [Bacteroidales bacterium]|nr:hypothetical protein [Bacteroidales bacterium]
MKKLIYIFILIMAAQGIQAQKYQPVSIGVGKGLNYGGMGVSVGFAPVKRFEMFALAGHNGIEYAYGGGANVYLLMTKKRKYRPNLKAFYGYTTFIDEESVVDYNKTYYGFTVGIGNEFRFGKNKHYGLDFDILFPLKSDEYKSAVSALRNDPVTLFSENFPPVTLSFALHVDFGKRLMGKGKKTKDAPAPAEAPKEAVLSFR